MKKPLSFIGFLVGIILFLSLLQIVVSNRLSTTGVMLGKLQDEIMVYKTTNSALQEKLLVATSLHTIASHAAEIGFFEVKSTLVLTAPVPVARKQ